MIPWESGECPILEAARWAEKEFNAELVVIKKTSQEYGSPKDKLPCPSVVREW